MAEASGDPSQELWVAEQTRLARGFQDFMTCEWVGRELSQGEREYRQEIPDDDAAGIFNSLKNSCVGDLILPVGTRFLPGVIFCLYGSSDVETAKMGVLRGLTVLPQPDTAFLEMCLDPSNPGVVKYAGFRFQYASWSLVNGGPGQYASQTIGIGVANNGLPVLIRDVDWCGRQLESKAEIRHAQPEDVSVVTRQVLTYL